MAGQPVGEQLGLPLALRRERRVAVPVDAGERLAGDHRLGLAVAHEQQLGRAGRPPEPRLAVTAALPSRHDDADAYDPAVHWRPMTEDLLDAALAVQANAHAPYSGFRVGAAVRTASGRSSPAATSRTPRSRRACCAEAAAIGAMVAAGEREIAEVLTVADGDDLTTCCGGCRQRIREFAAPDTLVHAAGPEGVRRTFTLDELLPASFGPEHLPRT